MESFLYFRALLSCYNATRAITPICCTKAGTNNVKSEALWQVIESPRPAPPRVSCMERLALATDEGVVASGNEL